MCTFCRASCRDCIDLGFFGRGRLRSTRPCRFQDLPLPPPAEPGTRPISRTPRVENSREVEPRTPSEGIGGVDNDRQFCGIPRFGRQPILHHEDHCVRTIFRGFLRFSVPLVRDPRPGVPVPHGPHHRRNARRRRPRPAPPRDDCECFSQLQAIGSRRDRTTRWIVPGSRRTRPTRQGSLAVALTNLDARHSFWRPFAAWSNQQASGRPGKS